MVNYLNKIFINKIIDDNDIETMFESLIYSIDNFINKNILTEELIHLKESRNLIAKISYDLNIAADENRKQSYILGFIKAITDMQSYQNNKTENDDGQSKDMINKYKYLKDIFIIIDSEDSISHRSLAKRLKISESNLSNIMSRLDNKNLFITQKYGRTKYYYLSPKAQNIYKKYLDYDNKKYTVQDSMDILVAFIKLLQKEISDNTMDVNEIVAQLNDMHPAASKSDMKILKRKMIPLFITINNQGTFPSNSDLFCDQDTMYLTSFEDDSVFIYE
jgi:DNA-binding MarR family transcriptional regulator